MRPPRIAILVLFFSASLFLFCRAISSFRRSGRHAAFASSSTSATVPLSSYSSTKSSTSSPSTFRTLFSFKAPFSLFPPNAAISLTDDNSTFFPARPAAFGPPLPTHGLSGQLWIGSGFADETLQEGDVGGEGELGCSDVVGWEETGRQPELHMKSAVHKHSSGGDSKTAEANDKRRIKRDDFTGGPTASRKMASGSSSSSQLDIAPASKDDGTDDYLHQGFQRAKSDSLTSSGSGHADIQSIQETAEITGKVVLLSRGGCGFLEKVKWAQRRGAIALIVGDNQKGGPLIQMFARGNTDNVSIPSVFTSRTTAHLLSSLMQPGSFIEDILDENGKPLLKVQQSGKSRKNKKQKATATATTTTSAAQMTSKVNSAKVPASVKNGGSKPVTDGGSELSGSSSSPARRGWFSRLFSWGSDGNGVSERSRPPSSGRLDWVLVDEWSDEKDKLIKSSMEKAKKSGAGAGSDYPSPAADSEKSISGEGDGFQIGVQDWRDPDLLESSSNTEKSNIAGSSPKHDSPKSGSSAGQFKGGSITPGSGEYSNDDSLKRSKSGKHSTADSSGSSSAAKFLGKIFGEDDEDNYIPDKVTPAQSTSTPILATGADSDDSNDSDDDGDDDEPDVHEGLWVTITPTSSASPFFDTLLVLVISPLITLTVVYALLVLRAKIRRRRWRAPKSVVERLPVRTYHTVAPTPSQPSTRQPSPTSSSPSTPLLQQGSSSSGAGNGGRRSRPRSRTTTGIPTEHVDELLRAQGNGVSGSGDLLRPQQHGHRTDSREKHNTGHHMSQWKKYMGRQMECVICLEEYVDGVSRVMSLPCGHEFHVECITPWLTTRRRTCPICKGDVVRSLNRGSPSSGSPRYEPYHDDSDDDEEDDPIAEASGSGASPDRSRRGAADEDLEAQTDSPSRNRGSGSGRRFGGTDSGSWFSLLSSGFGGVGSHVSSSSFMSGGGARRGDRRSGEEHIDRSR